MEMAITGPALASAAVGLAVDFVQHRLEEETEHYRAQFKGQATGDNFWWVIPAKGRGETAAQFHANIAGFRLRRYWRDGSTLASEVTFGMSLSNDGTLFRLCPLALQVSAAKAKVLSDEWRWLPLPTTWIRYALGSTGHGVAITTDLHMNAFSLDKDRKLHVDNLAGIEIPLPDYDINLGARLRTSETEPTKKLRVHPTGWLLAPPFPSLIGGSKARLAGAFDLTVVATESDPSNAKRLLERLAKRVGEEKDRLMKIVQN